MSDPSDPVVPKRRGRPPKPRPELRLPSIDMSAPPVAEIPEPPTPIPTPKKGAGRAPKAQAPQSGEQEALAIAIKEASARRAVAFQVYASNKNVESEMGLLQEDLAVASAWSAYLQATNNHTHAIRWSERETALAGRVATLRELKVADQLEALIARTTRENDAAVRVGRIK